MFLLSLNRKVIHKKSERLDILWWKNYKISCLKATTSPDQQIKRHSSSVRLMSREGRESDEITEPLNQVQWHVGSWCMKAMIASLKMLFDCFDDAKIWRFDGSEGSEESSGAWLSSWITKAWLSQPIKTLIPRQGLKFFQQQTSHKSSSSCYIIAWESSSFNILRRTFFPLTKCFSSSLIWRNIVVDIQSDPYHWA